MPHHKSFVVEQGAYCFEIVPLAFLNVTNVGSLSVVSGKRFLQYAMCAVSRNRCCTLFLSTVIMNLRIYVAD